MDFALITLIEILGSISILIILSIGLAVVFGMMKVINMAHGEFLMLGGYSTIFGTNYLGLNIWFSILVLAPISVGAVGLLLEWLVVRHLYGRMIDTMLATWGLSLTIIGLMTMLVGTTTMGISTPLPSMTVGDFQVSGYKIFLILLAVVEILGLAALLKLTKFGLVARATTQNASMVAVLGGNPNRMYFWTFGLGAALAGLGGAALAPISTVVPTIGASYIAKSFITVITGGGTIIAGNIATSGLFGILNHVFTYLYTPVLGEVALLVSAIVLIRLLPQGITGRFFKKAI